MAFRDGLGERRVTQDAAGVGLEALCLRRELAAVPSFEFALRERVTRLAGFRHAYYGRIRGVERSSEFDQALTVMSDATPGIRLSALLDTSHEQRLPVDLDVALCLIRQLVPAVAILHESARDASHGALGPERLIVTPNGRLVIVEYVLGSALEQLLFTRERYWTELRIALPRVAGLPRFDHLADVTQVGVVALSLILGRTLRDEEYPARIGEVVTTAMATTLRGEKVPLPPALRTWLQRALQLDARNSFPSAIEARAEFERLLSDSGYDASPDSLDKFMARYHAKEGPTARVDASDVKSAAPVRVAPSIPQVSQPSHGASLPSASPVPVVATGAPASIPTVAATPAPSVLPTPIMSAAAVPSPIVPLHSQPTHEPKAHEPKAHELKTSASSWVPPAAEAKVTVIKETLEPDKLPFSSGGDSHSIGQLKMPPRRTGGKLMKLSAATAVAVVVLGAVALIGARRFWAEVPAPTPTGTLVVTTNPAGAEAFVDGMRRGNTPITLELLAGSHRVELRGHGEPRVIPVTIAPGQEVAQYVDLPNIAPPIETKAEVVPEPPAPVDRSAADAAANGPGWLSISGKLEMQLFEGGHLLGTSKIERIMVPAGHHDLEMVNELIGFRGTRSLQVSPGKVTNVTVDLPKGTMAINAQPWAEVWMDGAKIGDTPIGNFAVAAGSHDVVFRHPDLGEQRETVLVTLKNPVRLSVDMRKP
jgi:serine/threonine protein kinase